MHPFKSLLLLLVAATFLTGMGNLNGAPVGTVPKVSEEIKARVTDKGGVATDLQQFSLDGKVIIEGTRGSASVAIPLREIASMAFQASEVKNELTAKIKLKDGQEVPLQLRKRMIFNGSTGYGAFVILAADVQQIEFL